METTGDISSIQATGTTKEFTEGINNLKASTGFVRDMTYCRLKSIGLSYEFPLRLLHPMGLKGGKLYVEGQNLWTGRNGYAGDPTILQSYMGIPSAAAILIGLEIKF
ncbi:hypothetical protein [Paraflavitalea speifideaquila]|uniref:hypothetical protein n=1 Tax=Paraflavitalea speifideaquila TaxID=3076558 RepID=UPI0028E23A0F|nr:hypothetical protein [Paraflavitalea speifideiaquila]